jgi:hypothetical protein
MAERERFFLVGICIGIAGMLLNPPLVFAQSSGGRAPPTLEDRVKALEQEYVNILLEQQAKSEKKNLYPQQEPLAAPQGERRSH